MGGLYHGYENAKQRTICCFSNSFKIFFKNSQKQIANINIDIKPGLKSLIKKKKEKEITNV